MTSLKSVLENIEQVAPTEFDAEDQAFGSWAPTEKALKKGDEDDYATRSHYVNVDKSSLRKQGQAEDDPKYAGKKVSRAQLFDMAPSDASSQDHAESSSQVSNGPDAELEQDENLPFGPIQSDSEQETSESEDSQPTVSNIGSKGKRKAVNFEDDEEEDAQPDDAKETQNMVQSLRKAASADVEKGQHVRRQLTLWDSLLEMRIKLQKPMSLVNTLPSPDTFEEYECAELEETKVNLANLLEQINAMRSELAAKNNTYSPPASKRRKIESVDDVRPLEEYITTCSQQVSAAESFLESTVKKWSDKVNAASTASLKNKSKFSSQNSVIFKNTWAQIQGALAADEGRLIERTKILRSGTEAIGGGEPTVVFDDADFYQQLLKDVVDHQLLDPDDPSMRALQLAAQAKKPKKHVDTKASKGRKLRYHVHEKLQNFMIPIPRATWSDQQTDELFRSLLGKGFEGYLQDGEQDVPAADGVEAEAGDGLEGLRIFG